MYLKREDLLALVDVLLYGDVIDDEIALKFANTIDERTFLIAMILSERQEREASAYTPEDIIGIARGTRCDEQVVLAMMGFLRDPVANAFRSVHDPGSGALVIDERRLDVLRALYVHRACCEGAGRTIACEVVLAGDIERPDDQPTPVPLPSYPYPAFQAS